MAGTNDRQADAARRVGTLRQQLVQPGEGLRVQVPTAAGARSPKDPRPPATDEHGNYSVALPEKLAGDGPWLVHRSVKSPRKLFATFPPPNQHVRTLYDNWESSLRKYPNEPLLGTRSVKKSGKPGPYKWKSFNEVGILRTAAGSGLIKYGIEPGSKIGLYSINCEEWIIMDAACHAYAMASVPLYDTLGPDAVRHICNHSEIPAVACSFAVLPVMLQCLAECPTVRLLVVYGTNGRAMPYPSTNSCQIVRYEQLIDEGKEAIQAHMPPKPDDIATICYTSGTTGVPKGAILTHGNLIAGAAGNASNSHIGPGDRHMSYLPLAHIYERVVSIVCIHQGVAMGFYTGDVLNLLEDLQELKPTVFVSVPRLWNRIYDKVMAQVNSGSAVTKALFHMAYASKKAALDRGDPTGGRMGAFWDRLVFSKVREKLGGQVRYLGSGASPLSKDVFDFLRICFGAKVMEGYGMTETSIAISCTDEDDLLIGHVGAPSPCCEVKLADIPDMNYLTTDKPYPRGEICVRGPNVFKGYYKDDVQTREALDEEGWLHTGDVGMWVEGGRLRIIDRKKNLFKLAQGEYVAPEKIEGVYQRCPLVAQAFVHGDSLKAQLVAVVVPDAETLLPWAKEQGLPQDVEALCSNPNVQRVIFQQMVEEGRGAKLQGFEQVGAIHLVAEPFSVENGLLTPTFKLKRPQAKAAFADAITGMYARLEAA
mmetsp:Transcript_22844/g.58572  ORF Transcript_22844/g.58572 Transcript_22844/m.58572 type:complete len:707 (+) Transcript_22844:279-2399(+)|eukprot:jgi/Tetstr1/454811/TSEL_041691.t1